MAKTNSRKSAEQLETSHESPLGLPSASDRLKLHKSLSTKLEESRLKEYDLSGGTKGDENSTSLNPKLKKFNPNQFLDFISTHGTQEDRAWAADILIKAKPSLLSDFETAGKQPDVSDATDENGTVKRTAQWADRTTGREVSPADFIKLHYGKMRDDGSWDPCGLTRGDIKKADLTLYNAYVRQVARNANADLGLYTVQRAKVADPQDALERRRAANRRAYHKAKMK